MHASGFARFVGFFGGGLYRVVADMLSKLVGEKLDAPSTAKEVTVFSLRGRFGVGVRGRGFYVGEGRQHGRVFKWGGVGGFNV